jgi:NAD(P)-dependent dehydrogenase (short-subunit alcohol dehydrogenase family)
MTDRNGYWAGRVVAVTGGSRNIGRAISQRFAADGARVVVNGVVPGEAAQAAAEMADAGLDAVAWDADVSDPAQVEAMFSDIADRFGGLDVLVNNAAVTMQGRVPFERLSLDDWDRIFAVNARGTFLCSAAAAPLLRERAGSIVNISSIGASKAHRSAVPYDATKGAIESFTRALALELAPDRVRVNAIAPGAISNDRYENLPQNVQRAEVTSIPLGRAGTGDEIASAVSFLASDQASYITGHVLTIDGGLTAQARQASSEIIIDADGGVR